MIHQISHQDLEHVYADAVNTIQCEMNFVEAVKALEDAAKAGHVKQQCFLQNFTTKVSALNVIL